MLGSFVVFQDYTICHHLTIPSLVDYVIEDIRTRYGSDVRMVQDREILLDPGGWAIDPKTADYVRFVYKGFEFSCQAVHQKAVLKTLRHHVRMVESPHGKLVRVYFPGVVLVIPFEWHYAICTFFDSFSEEGAVAAAELKEVLREVHKKINNPEE